METAEISTLNNRPDWLSMQYDSFCRFFSRKTSVDGFSLQHILGRHGVIQLEGDHTLSIKEWSLDEPNRGPEECIFSNCNYSRDLWFTFSVTGPRIGGREFQFSRCMVRLPVPTHDSEFILSSEQDKKANRYAMVMQLAPSPGLYYRERDSGASRSCTIIPAIGKRVVFRARKAKTGEKLSFLMGGFKLSLEDFRKVLDTDGPDDDDLTTLRSLYRYLFNRNLLPTDKQILYISEADIDGLAFVRQIFKKYLASFDMSCLGKKQMTSLLRDKTDGGTTLLGLEELEKIIDHFINRKLPQTDDRSLKYRKVKLIGDFLFELLEQSMVWLMNHVRNRWEFWGATESSRERGGSASSLRKEGLRSLIPYRPFQQLVDNFFRENSLIQLLDDTNPLSEISQKRRISFRGPGGIPERVLFLEKRDVHFTDFGRVCPVETPQGEDLGFNLYLAQNARINSLGLIEAPYVDLNSNEELFLDPYEEEEKVKAARVNPQTSKDGIAYVRTPTEEMAIMDESKITHALYGPCSFMGYAASLIPFIQHNDANRALMGANMMKQALPLLKPEPPMIRTGFESKIGEQCCRCSPFINNGHLCLGKNLLVGYMPWDLLNYEDGIVISDRLVQKDILTHVETGEFIVDEESYKGEGQFEEITADNPHLSESDRQKLDGMGVIREKESIGPGTLLVSKLRPLTPKEKIEEQKNPATWLAIAVFGKRAGERMKDASFYAPQQINGVVRKVEWIQDRLPSGVKRRVRILVELKHSIQVGDKLTGRHGNKGVVSSIIPEREMPYLKTQNNVCTDDNCKVTDSHTHLDILLNPLTITGRMNLGQLYETTVGWFAAHQNQDEKKCFIIPPFDKEWSWEKILSKLERNGLANKQILYIYEDNEETKLEYPVTVGYQYFLKLKHLAEKKLKARSQFVYNPTTGQPTVRLAGNKWDREWENKRVAQRLGEMEVWSLEAHSARNILDELLFLKSDDENLRQQIVEYIRETDRSQKQAFHQIIIKAREKKWKVETEGLDLKVICRSSEEAELREAALKLGLKTEKINEGTFLLHFAPLDLTQREHRAFKAFVHYCRALGLEIEGINRKGREFALVGRKASPWPEIIGLGIRLATDEERKKWSGNQVIKSSGTRDDGLWSNRMFGDIYNRSDINFINEATGIIELEMAVDNPLFRPVLGLLLDKRGYLLDEVRDKFQELVIELYPSIQWTWEDFWKKASEKRSSLQTVDDLIDWLESLQHDGSDTYTREELAKVIENKFSKINQFNFKEVLNPESHYYMNSRRLFHHFAVMDLKRLKAHLEATDELKAREKRQLELVEILLLSGYDLTVLFIKNLIVLPKNLRFERKRISNDDDPQYENDLNYLYQRILNQNQRIRNFCHKKAAEIMCTSEEEKLRRLVYALLSNDKIKGTLEEPLCWPGGGKVLRSILSHVTGWERGKESIFRQHLLGKRADFSARGVIVPDPALNLDEAGLPYSVGKALFRDFLINRLLKEIPDREEIVDERGKPTEKFRKILFGERLVNLNPA
jgi:DNA-directed RNA polymerase subunit beta